MSRLRVVSMLVSLRFPRVSGDEPGGSAGMGWLAQFSPRERG